MIDVKNVFGQPVVKGNLKTHHNIRKIATCHEDDYMTGFLLDYNHFKKHCIMIAIDLSKQQELDAD